MSCKNHQMNVEIQILGGIGITGFISWAAWVTKQIFVNKREDCIILSRLEQKVDDLIKNYDAHLK